MRRMAGSLLLVVAACTATTLGTTTTVPPTSSTTPSSPTTTEKPPQCPPAPYELEFLPAGVGTGSLDTEVIEPDVWTSVGGTHSTLIGRTDGNVAIALIRGTLPAVDWPGPKGEVSIDGTRAAVGPHPDGTWVAGWFEAPGERCDLYTMVFYPPWNPKDVEAVLAGMNRVGG
ncbi:MAG: hypothetical protein ACE5F5_03860 [Acidimicrobiia bacterium]